MEHEQMNKITNAIDELRTHIYNQFKVVHRSFRDAEVRIKNIEMKIAHLENRTQHRNIVIVENNHILRKIDAVMEEEKALDTSWEKEREEKKISEQEKHLKKVVNYDANDTTNGIMK